MGKTQIIDIWKEDTSWKAYIRFSRNLSFIVAFLMTMMLAMTGPSAFLITIPVGIFVFLLMLLSKALCDGCNKLYRYL